MVGLDAAGKTTILYKLKLGEIVTTIPTIGGYLPLVYFSLCLTAIMSKFSQNYTRIQDGSILFGPSSGLMASLCFHC